MIFQQPIINTSAQAQFGERIHDVHNQIESWDETWYGQKKRYEIWISMKQKKKEKDYNENGFSTMKKNQDCNER